MTLGLNRRLRAGKKVHHADPTKPYSPDKNYIHSVTLKCEYCQGTGWMRFANRPGKIICMACNGAQMVTKGCGGPCEVEKNYNLTYCFGCQGFIPTREATRPKEQSVAV